MLVSQQNLVHISTTLILWMILNTFVTYSFGIAAVIFALILGTVQYLRIPQIHESKISPVVLGLFNIRNDNLLKNMVFHKGGAYHAPENTLEAVQEAINLGIPAVEIDLDFTKDGVGVLIHGPRVDETTNGTGFVSDYTFEAIQKLNAAAKDVNKEKFPVVHIPTLEACVQLCIENNTVIFIDCKSNPAQTARLVTELYKKYPELYELGVVCSFYPSIIYALRQADPEILTGLTHREFILTSLGDDSERNKELWKRVISPFLDAILSWAHWSVLWYICGNSFFLSNKDKVCQESKKFWDRLGVRTLAWTVNNPLERDFLIRQLKVPVITDGLESID